MPWTMRKPPSPTVSASRPLALMRVADLSALGSSNRDSPIRWNRSLTGRLLAGRT